jgi:hypothetical protein
MQYSKWRGDANRLGIVHKRQVIAMLQRESSVLVLALLGFCLASCTDTMPAGKPLKGFTDLVRGYDRTLTEDEKKRVIKQLQEDKERQGLAGPEDGEAAEQPTEPAAKTAKSQVENQNY